MVGISEDFTTPAIFCPAKTVEDLEVKVSGEPYDLH